MIFKVKVKFKSIVLKSNLMEVKNNFLGNKVVLVDKEKEVMEKPYDFKGKHIYKKPDICPFCVLHERENHKILYKDEEDWNVAVVPNKFPFVEHSYVVVHKIHDGNFHNFSYSEEFGKAVKFLYNKAEKLSRRALIFKNSGFLAGASLKHSHEQGILFEEKYYPIKDSDKVVKELKNLENEKLRINEYSFCPSVPIRGYETWVVFDSFNPGKIKEWKRLSHVFRALRKTLGDFDFNLVLYYDKEERFPVFAQILPRFSPIAGLELALKMYVNPIIPEKSAKRIRKNFEVIE